MSEERVIALVTGATSGVGRAITRRLIADDAWVVACGRRTERLEELRRELGDHVFPLSFDVADRLALDNALVCLPEPFSRFTVLVNSAGVSLGSALAQDAKFEDWRRIVDTNVNGILNCTAAVLPGMVKRDRGDIINIGSAAGTYPYPRAAVYGATKAFVRQFTLGLRADLLGTNIRATCIEPAVIETEFAFVRTGDADKARVFYEWPEMLQPEDISNLTAYILNLPRRVNINTVEVFPRLQAFADLPRARPLGT